jgi:hypothetical protein
VIAVGCTLCVLPLALPDDRTSGSVDVWFGEGTFLAVAVLAPFCTLLLPLQWAGRLASAGVATLAHLYRVRSHSHRLRGRRTTPPP